tara:strand:- start:232 stop:477 length:246 start_codon:yes stop_codon:yes gene_type:complete
MTCHGDKEWMAPFHLPKKELRQAIDPYSFIADNLQRELALSFTSSYLRVVPQAGSHHSHTDGITPVETTPNFDVLHFWTFL